MTKFKEAKRRLRNIIRAAKGADFDAVPPPTTIVFQYPTMPKTFCVKSRIDVSAEPYLSEENRVKIEKRIMTAKLADDLVESGAVTFVTELDNPKYPSLLGLTAKLTALMPTYTKEGHR